VSISAYDEPIESGKLDAVSVGVNDGDGDTVGVPESEVPAVVSDVDWLGEAVDVSLDDAPEDGDWLGVVVDVSLGTDDDPLVVVLDTDDVCVSDNAIVGELDGETVRDRERVPDRDCDGVPEAVRDVVGDLDGVTVTVDVLDRDDPADGVRVPDRVGDGVGWTMPVTRKPHWEAEPGLKELVHAPPLFVVVKTPANESKPWSGGATVSPK
jgi:hypothetical protein